MDDMLYQIINRSGCKESASICNQKQTTQTVTKTRFSVKITPKVNNKVAAVYRSRPSYVCSFYRQPSAFRNHPVAPVPN